MGHDEAAVGKIRAARFILKTPATSTEAVAEAGTLKLSGSKVWFDNGTNWELITSAS